MRSSVRLPILSLAFALLASGSAASASAEAPPQDSRVFKLKSELLSAFWGRNTYLEAAVVLPPELKDGEVLPSCYNIHGFGGNHRSGLRQARGMKGEMKRGEIPRMFYVFLNASCPQGHHEFADSVNNGPWGAALTTELIPHLEEELGSDPRPEGRFLTGHSSGGWSSFWLQVAYPDFFDGTWSTAPDPVDLRDFTGINIYEDENAFTGPDGKPVQLMRRNGRFVGTIKQYCDQEFSRQPFGGQFSSFNAVFSPRGDDGRPMPLFDKESGVIDRAVADYWERYDISIILRDGWDTLGPKLTGKLRIYCGLEDTFRLEGACLLLEGELEELGSDAQFVMVEGRDHGTLFQPHPEHWPEGMMHHIHNEMGARYRGDR